MPVEKKNIFLSNTPEKFTYAAQGVPMGKPKIPERQRATHANMLNEGLSNVYKQNEASLQNFSKDQIAAMQYKKGVNIVFTGKQGYELVTKSLENLGQGVRLLNVKESEGTIQATVFVPEDKKIFFAQRILKYADAVKNNAETIPNKPLLDSIESITPAILKSFWIGKDEGIPDTTPVWCEIWLLCDEDNYENTDNAEKSNNNFKAVCSLLKISCNDNFIHFKERIVKLIRANSDQLASLIKCLDTIAEIRRFEEPNSFFEKLPPGEQKEFTDELFSRLQYDFSNVSICLLDTGLNSGHPLLSGSCEDDCLQAVNIAWQASDHDGHGTEMAGIALFYNLKEKLLSSETIVIHHHLESVKILPPPPGANDPQLYGDITRQAISLAEIARPNNVRTLCMAITEDNRYSINDGTPSSWSGYIDTIISGADDNTKRLFFISAGNVDFSDMKGGYPGANLISPVQSPGQAWNAITVGAYSNDVTISDVNLKSYHAVANVGELSPYSSTSKLWNHKWPIKPEILCDGGNVATDGSEYTGCSDLSLLTTSHQHLRHPFSTIEATSSATAQASWIAAQIMSEYPGIWPETVRALIVHSADWTDQMKRQFIGSNNNKGIGKRDLLRTCGYGIPNLERAIQCISNRVNLVIEGEIQPFAKSKKMNEMHLHTLPWASDILRDIGETPALLKITLSYFVEPGPGEIGWRDKYRYPSCQLRFDVKNANETKDDFVKRIDVKMREDDDRGSGYSGSTDWFLGPINRNVGSIHSDFKEANAVDLCEANFVAVYPVIGWWRERTNLKCYDKKIRYSLVISISTPETDVDLYTPIVTQIQQPVPISV